MRFTFSYPRIYVVKKTRNFSALIINSINMKQRLNFISNIYCIFKKDDKL